MFKLENRVELHLNAYHHDPHLLIQFILTEFFGAYECVETLMQQQVNKRTLSKIKPLLTQLIIEKQSQGIFPWNAPNCHINKLHKYCLHLSNMDINESIELMRTLTQLLDSSYACLEMLNKENIAGIKLQIPKIKMHIELFSKEIEKMLPQFTNNENVVLFLLKHQQTLAKLYGTNSLHNLLTKEFRGWKKEVSKFLEKKFAERGFSTLFPLIQNKLQELNSNYEL